MRKRNRYLDAGLVGLGTAADVWTLQHGFDPSDPVLKEAYDKAFPSSSEFDGLSEAQRLGVENAWKGKYFEQLVADRLNAGDHVGPLVLEPGQRAVLAAAQNQPGWDLQILDDHGDIIRELQLKATDSLGPIQEALDRYSDTEILSTSEAAFAAHDAGIGGVYDSGINDRMLEDHIGNAFDGIAGNHLLDHLAHWVPFIPYVAILVTERRDVRLKRKKWYQAVKDGTFRSVKSLGGHLSGDFMIFAGAGIAAVPISIGVRFLFDRHRAHGRSEKGLRTWIEEMKDRVD
jgi:hypothetical protein